MMDEMEAPAHGKPINLWVQLVLYDSFVECIRVPLWKGEVVKEPRFDFFVALVAKGEFFLEAKRVELSVFELLRCLFHDKDPKAKGHIGVCQAP